MDFRELKRSFQDRGIIVKERNLTTQQKMNAVRIMNSMLTGGASITNLIDSDGVSQFIYGVTPMSNEVRVGHSI